MLRASRDDNSVEDGGSSCEESSVDDETNDMIDSGDDDDKLMKLHKQWRRVASRMTRLDKDNMKAIALLALVVMVFLRLGQTTNNGASPQTTTVLHTKSLRAHGPDTTEESSKATKSKHGAPIDEDEDTNDPTANAGGSSNNLLLGGGNSGGGGGYLSNGGGLGLMGNNQFGMQQQQQNFMQPGLMQQQGLATQQVLLQQQQQQQAAAMLQQQQQQQVMLQQQAQKQLEEQVRLQQEAFQKQQEAILLQQQQQQQQLMLQQMQNPQQQQQHMLGGQQQQGFLNMANFGGLQQQQNGLTLPGGAGTNSLMSNNPFMGQAGMTMPQQQMGQLTQFGGSMGAAGPMTGTTGLMDTTGLMGGTTGLGTPPDTSGTAGLMTDTTGTMGMMGGGAAAAADPMAQAMAAGATGAAVDPMAQVTGSMPVDPALAGRPNDAEMAQVAAEIPLNDLANFRDSWAPYNEKDIPIYFHIPKAGGSTVKDVIGSCLRMVMASEFGVTDGHDKDTEIAIVYPKVPGGTGSEDRSPFINVDTTTVAGIDRAAKMGFADSGLAGCVVTPFLYESNALFTPTAQGRLFAVFRHPVDRAVSMFYYIQVATWEPSYMPELQSWTLEQYATSTVIENNWMTRQLANQLSGDLDDSHLKIAMEVIRRKFMVGLMNKLPASMTRFEKFYRLKYHVNPTNQEACRERLTSGGSNSNSKNKKEKPKKGEPLWDLVAAQNLFDIQLYEYIEALFVEQEAFVADIPDDYRNIDATCCKCDPPTFPPGGFACPKKVLNAA